MGGSPGEANLVQQIVLTMGQRNVKVHIGRDQYEKAYTGQICTDLTTRKLVVRSEDPDFIVRLRQIHFGRA